MTSRLTEIEDASSAPPQAVDQPASLGERNQNPPGLGFFALLREDLRTYEGDWSEPGFLAVFVHRLGNWRMSLKPKLLRAPFSVLYRILYRWVRITYGIKLEYTVRVGRRLRIWHHGGMVLGAYSIGDDVHIRQNTTFGVARRGEPPDRKPRIGNRVDIGCGACVLGPLQIGDDSIIGANAVVLNDVPPRSLAVGVPARVLQRRDVAEEGSSTTSEITTVNPSRDSEA